MFFCFFFNLHIAEQSFLELVKLFTRLLTHGAQAHYKLQQSRHEPHGEFLHGIRTRLALRVRFFHARVDDSTRAAASILIRK